jgi:quinol monooxygenase YgiN
MKESQHHNRWTYSPVLQHYKQTMVRLLSMLLAALTITSGAAPQSGTTFHAVSYVEVLNSSGAHSSAIAALKAYQTACKGQEGFGRLESFEQSGRPGHFVFVETWRDEDAFNKRSAAAQKALADALDRIRISDVDRRPYKTFNAADASRTSRDTVYVITHVDASPQPQLPMMLLRLAEDSRRDDGNLRFDIIQHTQRANHYTIIEAWRDRKSLDAHTAALHTKQYREEFAPMAGSPLDERVFQAMEL